METVLIIEDDAALSRGLKDNFAFQGYHVLLAADGEAGLNLAVEGKPNLIVLDLMLPKMNGYEICRRLRREKLEIPILMLTAKAEESDVVLGLELGAGRLRQETVQRAGVDGAGRGAAAAAKAGRAGTLDVRGLPARHPGADPDPQRKGGGDFAEGVCSVAVLSATGGARVEPGGDFEPRVGLRRERDSPEYRPRSWRRCGARSRKTRASRSSS